MALRGANSQCDLACSLATCIMLTVACCHLECCMPSGLAFPRLVALLYVMLHPIPQQILASQSSIRHEPVFLFWIKNEWCGLSNFDTWPGDFFTV